MVCNALFSDPGTLHMYLITAICYYEGKIKWNGIVHHFYIDLQRETILTISDNRPDFLCPFGSKEPDVRKSSDRKIKRFEYTQVDHIHP